MKYLLSAFVLLIITSCSIDQPEFETQEFIDFTAQNEEEILTFIADNDLDAIRSETGLYYVVNNLGTGTQPNSNSDVVVSYTGSFTNGEIFDQSGSDGISFNLQNVIAGWTEGITYFQEGGDGILLIPSHLGFGSFDTQGIPAGSVLIFDVNIISSN